MSGLTSVPCATASPKSGSFTLNPRVARTAASPPGCRPAAPAALLSVAMHGVFLGLAIGLVVWKLPFPPMPYSVGVELVTDAAPPEAAVPEPVAGLDVPSQPHEAAALASPDPGAATQEDEAGLLPVMPVSTAPPPRHKPRPPIPSPLPPRVAVPAMPDPIPAPIPTQTNQAGGSGRLQGNEIQGKDIQGKDIQDNAGETGISTRPDAPALDVAGYLARVRDRLQAHLVFPPEARRLRRSGAVRVQFRIRRDGSVPPDAVSVMAAPGAERFIAAALDTVRRAEPFPAPPVPEMSLELPISFALR